jgi:hypothetical protein
LPLVALLITAGFQLPTIPFGEVLFNVGAADPVQIANVVAKSGTTLLVTVTAKVTGDVHCPAFGVNR